MDDEIDLPYKRKIVEDVVAMTRRKYEQLIARVAELERQRDQVLALCDEADASGNSSDWDAPSGDAIRKIYGGGE